MGSEEQLLKLYLARYYYYQGIQERGYGHFVTREYLSRQTVYYNPDWYYDEQNI